MVVKTISRGNDRYTYGEEIKSCFIWAEIHGKYAIVLSPPAQLYFLGEGIVKNVSDKFK